MAPSAAHTADGISSPIDFALIPSFWRRKNGILLYFLLTSSLLASAALGIDGVSCRLNELLETWANHGIRHSR